MFSRLAGTTATPGTVIASAPYNNVINDLVTDANTPRPIVAGGTAATTAAAALVNLGLTATAAEINKLDGVTATTAELNLLDGVTATTDQLNTVLQLSGRNLIINGQGRVNQRQYVSGTATTAVFQYTIDRWRVVVSGQSLTFTGSDAWRVMTAPAGGVQQSIEDANVEGGEYVINWTGTATCTVSNIARAKGEVFNLAAFTEVPVRFSNGTFSDVQVEKGTTPTPFERLAFSDELMRCQRYYCKSYSYTTAPGTVTNNGALRMFTYTGPTLTSRFDAVNVGFPVTMRVAPTVTVWNPGVLNTTGTFRQNGAGTNVAAVVGTIGTGGASFFLNNATVVANEIIFGHYTADAEI